MEVMGFLDELFTTFDGLVDAVEQHGVYKVETIGKAPLALLEE